LASLEKNYFGNTGKFSGKQKTVQLSLLHSKQKTLHAWTIYVHRTCSSACGTKRKEMTLNNKFKLLLFEIVISFFTIYTFQNKN